MGQSGAGDSRTRALILSRETTSGAASPQRPRGIACLSPWPSEIKNIISGLKTVS